MEQVNTHNLAGNYLDFPCHVVGSPFAILEGYTSPNYVMSQA
jgi:hypothetical protein